MATYNVDSKYKTTTATTAYTDSLIEYKSCGTIAAGTVIKFSKIFAIINTWYGMIASSPAVSYTKNVTGGTESATGKLVLMTNMIEVSDSSDKRGTVTCKTIAGDTLTISNIYLLSTPVTKYVAASRTLTVYSGPGTVYSTVKTMSTYTPFSVYGTWKDNGGNLWYAINSSCSNWVLYSTNGTRNAAIIDKLPSTTDSVDTTTGSTTNSQLYNYTTGNLTSTSVTDASNDTYADMDAVQLVLKEAAYTVTEAESESLEALNKMQYVIGIPPKITPTADIPYMTSERGIYPDNNFGRCYTEMFMMGNTVFSIQPCKVKYLPGMSDDDQNTFWGLVSDISLGDDSALKDGTDLGLTGQLFEAQPDYATYINTVNLLARTMAIYLGIGDKTYMNTSTKYRDMDYSWYKIQTGTAASSNGLFGAVAESAVHGVSSVFSSVINDDTYLHFYMTADGTSVNENLSVSTKQSGLESLFNNNFSELAQEIQFLAGGDTGTGSTFQQAIEDATNSLSGVADSMSTTVANIVRYGGNYLQGGRLVFPQMLDDCTYDRSYSGTCRFISASGDPEAIFLNCYLPLCYLLPYSLPQMLSDNMYRYPFLAKVNAKGLYHCDLAAITGMRIQRGGQDGTCWTADGLPFEVDVSFDVTPLYSKLMVTNSRHPILFLSNTALHEYLGAMCGISFEGNQLELKKDIIESLGVNAITDTIPSMLRGFYSSAVANWLRKLFNY